MGIISTGAKILAKGLRKKAIKSLANKFVKKSEGKKVLTHLEQLETTSVTGNPMLKPTEYSSKDFAARYKQDMAQEVSKALSPEFGKGVPKKKLASIRKGMINTANKFRKGQDIEAKKRTTKYKVTATNQATEVMEAYLPKNSKISTPFTKGQQAAQELKDMPTYDTPSKTYRDNVTKLKPIKPKGK